jgi:hypothetical protein
MNSYRETAKARAHIVRARGGRPTGGHKANPEKRGDFHDEHLVRGAILRQAVEVQDSGFHVQIPTRQ